MKKFVIVLAILALASPALAAAYTADPGDVVVSTVYGGGGNTGAVYNRDFVELFNRTNHAIDISGWSIQYGSATGTLLGGTSTAYQFTVPAGTTMQPCHYFLVGMAFGANTTLPALPTVDGSGAIAMSGTGGKVALVADATPLGTSCTGPALIDIVAYSSTATCSETSPAGATTNATAAVRIVAGIGGLQDTNNNSADFTITTPVAHNSESSPLFECQSDPISVETSTWGTVKSLYR